MEYFLLKLSPKVKNPIRLQAYYADTDSPIVTYESLKELSVADRYSHQSHFYGIGADETITSVI